MSAARPTRIDPPPDTRRRGRRRVGTVSRVRDPVFPQPGGHAFHLWPNGDVIAHRSLSRQQV